MLSKNELAREVENLTGVKPNLVKNVLDAVAEIGTDAIKSGEDFTIPGLAKISFRYTSPLKKGERHKKGETYTGFGGVETTAEEDSKARLESIKLVAAPMPAIKKIGKLKKGTAAYKNVVARKKR